MFTFDVDATSEVVLAPDRNGPIQAFLEVSRDHGLPRGRVAAEHDERDVRVEAEGGADGSYTSVEMQRKLHRPRLQARSFRISAATSAEHVISNGDHRVP